MIRKLLHQPNNKFWFIFHLALGALSTLSVIPFIAWFYLVLFSSLIVIQSVNQHERNQIIIGLMAYLGSLELLARMCKTSPYIPYEISKYLFALLLLIGIFNHKSIKSVGWLMLLVLLPAMLYDYSGQVFGYEPLIFNLMGPVNVALAVVYFTHVSLTKLEFTSHLRLIFYSIISALVFTLIITPDFDEIDFMLGANFETSGGFGSNQVSTAFGVGIFIMYIAWLEKWKFSGSVLLDILLLFAFAFQGILTFSRGGIIGGVLGIIVFIFISLRNRSKEKSRLSKVLMYSLAAVVLGVLVFNYADKITGGMITLRYQGETAGTVAGTKENTLNNFTANRYDIFIGDMELWAEYPLLGVGAGSSRYMRSKVEGIVAHIELSRLVAEHGILGLIFFLLLIKQGINLFKRKTSAFTSVNIIKISLFVIAIFTSFHAAMRTFITPLLIGISLVNISEERINNLILRKNGQTS